VVMGTASTAGAASASISAAHSAAWGGIGGAGSTGGENGELFFKAGRTAMGALGSLPVAGADEDFAIFTALFALEFVDRHRASVNGSWSDCNGVNGWERRFWIEEGFGGAATCRKVPTTNQRVLLHREGVVELGGENTGQIGVRFGSGWY
jgi:hypothetical protein